MKFNSYTWETLSSFVQQFIANVEERWHLAPRERTHENLPTVYCLIERDSNKIWYIGQTQSLLRRILQHENSEKIAKASWDTVAYLKPGIPSPHIRLQVEGILQIAAVPPLCQMICLRRLKNDQWKEIKSFKREPRRTPRIKLSGKSK